MIRPRWGARVQLGWSGPRIREIHRWLETDDFGALRDRGFDALAAWALARREDESRTGARVYRELNFEIPIPAEGTNLVLVGTVDRLSLLPDGRAIVSDTSTHTKDRSRARSSLRRMELNLDCIARR